GERGRRGDGETRGQGVGERGRRGDGETRGQGDGETGGFTKLRTVLELVVPNSLLPVPYSPFPVACCLLPVASSQQAI
ncbi:MAG: hypothetical protein AB4426_03685, partial [Xenococcaceae cyanobacterium]